MQQIVEELLAKKEGLRLEQREEGLTLTDGSLTMRGDLTTMLPRLKPNNLNGEMLVKASKIKGIDRPLRLVDATAGMGEDSLLLAAAGFQVTLFEKDPVIAALLADSLERAKDVPELSDIVGRMELIQGDSIAALRAMGDWVEEKRPDVVLLDPMFPSRQKSGLIKKKFQLLQQLEQPCDVEEDMLEAAMAAGPMRIVIKRPAKGPYLAGKKPSYSLDGKAIRYDVIVFPR